MKVIQALLILLFSAVSLYSQYGASVRYSINSSEIENGVATESYSFPNAVEAGLGYWFRMKKKRLEFFPEISVSQSTSLEYRSTEAVTNEFQAMGVHINFNMFLYPLDFHSDCSSCPTFSKEGTAVKKGFYWILSPGVAFINQKVQDNSPLIQNDEKERTHSSVSARLGIGAGLDLGVSNLLTISPFVMYNYVTPIDYSKTVVGAKENAISQIHLGLRMILRLDKDKW